eukprot:279035_1
MAEQEVKSPSNNDDVDEKKQAKAVNYKQQLDEIYSNYTVYWVEGPPPPKSQTFTSRINAMFKFHETGKGTTAIIIGGTTLLGDGGPTNMNKFMCCGNAWQDGVTNSFQGIELGLDLPKTDKYWLVWSDIDGDGKVYNKQYEGGQTQDDIKKIIIEHFNPLNKKVKALVGYGNLYAHEGHNNYPKDFCAAIGQLWKDELH